MGIFGVQSNPLQIRSNVQAHQVVAHELRVAHSCSLLLIQLPTPGQKLVGNVFFSHLANVSISWALRRYANRLLLLGASYSVIAYGLVACSESTMTGFPVPSVHYFVTLGWHFTPGLIRGVTMHLGTAWPKTSSLLGLRISRFAGSA